MPVRIYGINVNVVAIIYTEKRTEQLSSLNNEFWMSLVWRASTTSYC